MITIYNTNLQHIQQNSSTSKTIKNVSWIRFLAIQVQQFELNEGIKGCYQRVTVIFNLFFKYFD